MSESGFVRKGRRTVYENPWLRFEAHEIVHPNGKHGEHGLVALPDASAVVVLDGDDVILTKQARYAIDQVVLEIVKGGAKDGESAQAAAARELREELGLEAARWDELGVVYELPSIIPTALTVFLARDLTRGASEPEDVESIVPVRMPFAAALHAAATGVINDAATIAALMRTAHFLRT